jgi:hypothetical protein
MTTDDFIAMTQRIIAQDGFDDYLPTLVLPDSARLFVLEGIPPDVDHDFAARRWVAKKVGPGDNYFLAFKISATQFRVVVRIAGNVEERVTAAHCG